MSPKFNKTWAFCASLLAIGLALPATSVAQVPNTMTVQGILRDAAGEPIEERLDFEFSLVSNGNVIWNEDHRVDLRAGLFTITLGDDQAITSDLLVPTPELVMTVDGEEMDPIELTSVPYALRADTAENLDGTVNWDQLSNVPAGFADGTDDGGGSVSWNDVTDIPTGFADGTDDGAVNWSDLQGIPADFADGTDDIGAAGGGDITSVTAGDGLLGGTTVGDAQLSVAFAGSGTEPTVARSDHTHAPPQWSEIQSVPSGFADGTDDEGVTTVNAGTGLTGGGSSASVTVNVDYGGDGAANTASRSDHTHAAGAAGVVFTRWGRNDCPSGTTLVYPGYAGGGHYTHGGSGPTICLAESPTWGNFNDSLNDVALVYGLEYQMNGSGLSSVSPFNTLHDDDAACAVCLDTSASTQFMLPGRDSCPAGWNTRVQGYLMGTQYQQSDRGWSCVDQNAEPHSSSSPSDANGALWYPAEGRCNATTTSLPCGPGEYVNGREITCAICTR